MPNLFLHILNYIDLLQSIVNTHAYSKHKSEIYSHQKYEFFFKIFQKYLYKMLYIGNAYYSNRTWYYYLQKK